MRYALLSVSDKTGIVELARTLAGAGYALLSSGGTAFELEQAGLEVQRVAEYTGSSELLQGRVKTLHPKIHAGILARDNSRDRDEMEREGIALIDIVAVNLYPFRAGRENDATKQDLIELIDIGGAALLRAGAKNWERVAALSSPAAYPEAIRQLKAHGEIDRATRERLAGEAFRLTADYDAAIAAWLGEREHFGPQLRLRGDLRERMRYGENPGQDAAFYLGNETEGTSLAGVEQLGGKVLSYNNIVDLESALELILEFKEPAAAVIKHTNPCGCALGKSPAEAFRRALAGDPKSAFGGIVALNREVDRETAELIAGIFVEALLAPGFTDEALRRLRRKKNLRLLAAGPFRERPPHIQVRTVYGGFLAQESDAVAWAPEDLKVAAGPEPAPGLLGELEFAWRVCAHVKSNAIVLTRERAIIGVGAGQMSRIDAAELALKKAAETGAEPRGSVLASDAFFPFRDVVDLAARAGIAAIVQPGGSIRDEESIAAAQEHGITLVLTGRRHFRH